MSTFNMVLILCISWSWANSGFDDDERPLKLAFCLTGQLARLELMSKVMNIFSANAEMGHTVHVFVVLDNRTRQVKQTLWKYDYDHSLYEKYDNKKMEYMLRSQAQRLRISDHFKSFVRIEIPSQDEFEVVHGVVPVYEKTVHSKKEGESDLVEPAWVRFQNNMRWLAGLRDCVRWMQQQEVEQGWFYDLVIRLRDDSFAFGKWKFSQKYKRALTSASVGSFRGVNDHNFVIDRIWADTLFRGFTEDYYFNKSLENVMWDNPEHRIYTLATSYNIPVKNVSVCEEPLVPLRGKHNATHWLIHPAYTEKYVRECLFHEQHAGCVCDQKWIEMMEDGHVKFVPPVASS